MEYASDITKPVGKLEGHEELILNKHKVWIAQQFL